MAVRGVLCFKPWDSAYSTNLFPYSPVLLRDIRLLELTLLLLPLLPANHFPISSTPPPPKLIPPASVFFIPNPFSLYQFRFLCTKSVFFIPIPFSLYRFRFLYTNSVFFIPIPFSVYQFALDHCQSFL